MFAHPLHNIRDHTTELTALVTASGDAQQPGGAVLPEREYPCIYLPNLLIGCQYNRSLQGVLAPHSNPAALLACVQ